MADAALAEDLVQDTLPRALQRADSFRGGYRTAVDLHAAEAMTVAEIAELQGVGLPAAKQPGPQSDGNHERYLISYIALLISCIAANM